MMYDDVAWSSENPFPGQLFNEPGGVDVYGPVKGKIAYNGTDVTAQTFLGVLQGQPQIVGKPVLQSTKQDNVFVYFSDHGASGLIAMPTGPPLYADQLIQALEYMYDQGMYNQLVFYLEACESGSMFDGILPANISVFATTAANPTESSYAYYYNDTLQTYMADEYSIRWMQDTEANWNDMESLEKQFQDVVAAVTESHPQQYGDFDFDAESIKDFEAFSNSSWSVINYSRDWQPASFMDSRDVKLAYLQKRYLAAKSVTEKAYAAQLVDLELANRRQADLWFRVLTEKVTGLTSVQQVEELVQQYTPPRNFECLRTIFTLYEERCEKFSDYSLKYVRTVVNLCEMYDEDKVVARVKELCI
jgi:legumain